MMNDQAEVKQEEHEVYVRKRPGRRLKMKARKRSKWQKTDSDVEDKENLKTFLQIIPNEDEEINYEIFRSDGSSRWLKSVAEMITKFDRMDLEELNALVMKRFINTSPTVHILQLEDGTELFLLAERRYPLTKETLKRMMDLKLVAEFASESAYNLLRFIQMQIDEE
ncbi:hypothetical protein Tco_1388497 [Tanacetum coccineum]